MSENLKVWEKYKSVPQEALKDFNNGKFKGTDINTMWRIKCLTEEFGMCGVGWYFVPKKLWIETTTNNEQFAFAEIELFVKVDGEWSKPISGNGGNKLTRYTKEGECSTSDEAYKMAVTDALGVACRNLGFGADVYWQHDKTKYTEHQYSAESKPATGRATQPKSIDEEAKTLRWSKGKHAGELAWETPSDYLERITNSDCSERLKDICQYILDRREEESFAAEEDLPF